MPSLDGQGGGQLAGNNLLKAPNGRTRLPVQTGRNSALCLLKAPSGRPGPPVVR